MTNQMPVLMVPRAQNIKSCNSKGDVTRDDLQRPFLAQHSIAMLEQCCNYSKQCRNNVTTLCCDKNRRCESSRVTSPSAAKATITASNFVRAAHFSVHFFAIVLHDYNMKLPETSWLHVKKYVFLFPFFHCRSFSRWWPLAFLNFSLPLQNFHLFLQQKMSPLFFLCQARKRRSHEPR